MTHQKILFCPYCGTPIIEKETYGGIHPVCPACNWVYFQDPKVAAASLVMQDSQVLLVQRSCGQHEGKWALPAGFVNAFEEPSHAAERECSEETGIIIEATELINVYTGREDPYGADIVLVYRGKILTGGRLCAGDDAKQAMFFPLDKLPPLAFRSTIELLSS